MVRDLLRARASAEIGAHERAEDLKRSMIENMPPKGTFLSDFIRTFAILDSVSVGNLFFATLK
jgi:hypothetical protein